MENPYSNNTAVGTAASAKVFLAMLVFSNPTTASSTTETQVKPVIVIPASRITSHAPTLTLLAGVHADGGTVATLPDLTTSDAPIATGERATTAAEKLIGEIRGWTLLDPNWDGEGAAAPIVTSLKESVAFIRLLGNAVELPDPMLLSAGHAGLFWKTGNLYADLEFLGDGRIAYFIEHEGEGKHKGVVKFDSEKMPAVFPALLRS